MDNTPIEIAGAGPAGLAAAITLAHAGRNVIVHEANAQVGHRFKRDLQGLDNWSTQQDVLSVLRSQGLSTDFNRSPCCQGTAFDAWGKAYHIRNKVPLFYLVERGAGEGTLDTALLHQAQELGVEIHFKSRIKNFQGPGIFATGPKTADIIAVGYHFDTSMPDGFWVICDDNLAPKGYAYLLVMDGKGTVKSCMFAGFEEKAKYVQQTVETFKRLVGLEMFNQTPHGGIGNFRLPGTFNTDSRLFAGEGAGIQDNLWGFGMRSAITSGILAARSLLDGSDYESNWGRELRSMMSTSLVNRTIYSMLGNRGYRWFLHHVQNSHDIRAMLHRQYHPSPLKSFLLPFARRHYQNLNNKHNRKQLISTLR